MVVDKDETSFMIGTLTAVSYNLILWSLSSSAVLSGCTAMKRKGSGKEILNVCLRIVEKEWLPTGG